MSLSAPFIPAAFKDALDKTEPFWDYIVGNESEALAWAQSHGVKVISSRLLKDCLKMRSFFTELT
jgi:hypothetical protein